MLIFVVITLCKYSDFIKLITEQPLHFVYNSRFIHFIMLKVYPHIFPFSNNLIPFQRSAALSSILSGCFQNDLPGFIRRLHNGCHHAVKHVHLWQMKLFQAGRITISTGTITPFSFHPELNQSSVSGQRFPSLSTTLTVTNAKSFPSARSRFLSATNSM